MILEPIPGDPDAVLLLADSLDGSAADLRATMTTVRSLTVGAVWDGPAGAAFGASLTDLGPVLQRVLDRYVGAAATLRAHAPELRQAQEDAQAALLEGRDAADQSAWAESRIESAMALGETWESPTVQGWLSVQRRAEARRLAAEVSHAAAWSRVRESDGRCATGLEACADDPIADPALYRLLHRVSATGSAVSQLGLVSWAAPELKPVAAMAGSAGALADTALLVVYDEGDWGQVGLGLALGAVGQAGGALRAGAKVGAVKVANGHYRVVERLDARARLGIGVRRQAMTRVDALHGLKSVPTGRVAGTATLGFAPKVPLQEKARNAVVDVAHTKLLDDIGLVRANGTQRMFVAGVTLQAGAKVGDKAIARPTEQRAPEQRPSAG